MNTQRKEKHSNDAKIHSVDDNEQDGNNEMKLLIIIS